MKKRFFTRPITVVVSEEMYQNLIEINQKTDNSLCEWIRDAITIKLETHNQIEDKER